MQRVIQDTEYVHTCSLVHRVRYSRTEYSKGEYKYCTVPIEYTIPSFGVPVCVFVDVRAGTCNTPHLRAASPFPPPPLAASAGRSRHARGAAPSLPAGRSAAADAWKWWAGWHHSQKPPVHALHPSPPPLTGAERRVQ